jgi:hypothetical protein
MPQLLSFFDSGKGIFRVVEKLNPKTHWGLGVKIASVKTYSSQGLEPCEEFARSR